MQAWRSGPVLQLERTGAVPAVRAFDSAAGQLVPVGPASGTARMYVCGITPYDATHIGHANTYVAFDLLNRVWRDAGLAVEYVQNVTDVDDPLIERARDTGVDWADLARDQTQLFREDMEALNVLAPSHYIGAVESIPLVVELVADLQARGLVYAVQDEHAGDLYLDQAQDPAFGSLSHLDEAAALPVFAERGGDPERSAKKGPLDSLVWLLHRDGDPAWPSPFGQGRPGWHVECAAIALQLLGPDFDVQAGGSDLVFPHHEMSASVGRLATGQSFAKAYLHSGMVALEGEKMSKSRGNLVFVSSLRRDGVDPMAVRLALLAHHYRDDWEWTPAVLSEAEDRLARWREAVRSGAGVPADGVLAAVRGALADDLDAPSALAAVDAWAGASTAIDGDDTDAPRLVASACDALLGVRL
ncbi:MAG: L-cysteine:1D-myo-inosityl 2-amino-2-deoxy-alpha-D-glucopyranoside ligase MshC [uncultured Friedmanniella sp.]|uniref:L-cysteine:1D-myo-inositol 2-amino-2-deoxy-alpha-D-glucopyranoside ligase n=1 Tax=uncultured Friedmanniella sp. TaxID=335381 RepID=A0A6J4KEX5_9ACTN|nr:cysteine--1-D-myo-inosityl 2-amino-2-deoxy-alpha-D-glucopyranoside ligase [uncultured Friedmanniella sp.]CAA9302865.1 MAG: L-cysteine:1D-myo-inosityl 2-amino-2-deoxy-alpha-D-glucopyranoside ligase MshC [uncultured Friedmanniella sp.]